MATILDTNLSITPFTVYGNFYGDLEEWFWKADKMQNVILSVQEIESISKKTINILKKHDMVQIKVPLLFGLFGWSTYHTEDKFDASEETFYRIKMTSGTEYYVKHINENFKRSLKLDRKLKG